MSRVTQEEIIEAGLEAVCDKYRYQDGARRFYKRMQGEDFRVFLSAALRVIAQNPPVPRADEWEDCFFALNGRRYSNSQEVEIAQCVEWEKRFFQELSNLSPEGEKENAVTNQQ